MHKIIILLLLTLLTAQANTSKSFTQLDLEKVVKINEFYKKNLQKTCGRTAPNFAQLYTHSEWLTMNQKHDFILELIKICPRSQEKIISILKKDGKKKFEDFYRYSLKYSKDSGLFPPS